MSIRDIKKLFDLGVTIIAGDDSIDIIGRNYHSALDSDSAYEEHMFSFPLNTSLDHIHNTIKSDLETRETTIHSRINDLERALLECDLYVGPDKSHVIHGIVMSALRRS
jgi:hypothetical protein